MCFNLGSTIPDPILSRFVEAARTIIVERLLGVYLQASLEMECFTPKTSDLELLVGVDGSLDDDVKRRFMDSVVELHEEFAGERACACGFGKVAIPAGFHAGIEMSVVRQDVCRPFVYPTPFELHFSAMHLDWYKKDPAGYVGRMKGCDKDLAAHVVFAKKRGRCLFGMPAEDFFGEVPEESYFDSVLSDVCSAESEILENTCYLVLNLAQVLAYKKEGLFLSKKEGGLWALQNIPPCHREIVNSALGEYACGGRALYDENAALSYASFMLSEIRS